MLFDLYRTVKCSVNFLFKLSAIYIYIYVKPTVVSDDSRGYDTCSFRGSVSKVLVHPAGLVHLNNSMVLFMSGIRDESYRDY